MADHPNVAATRAALEAFMKGDRETMMAGIADDAVWHIRGANPFSGDFRGKAEIAARFERMTAAGATVSLDDVHDIVGGDDHVVALVQLSASGSGGSTTQRAVWVFHPNADGKASEFWGYAENQAEIDAAFGG